MAVSEAQKPRLIPSFFRKLLSALQKCQMPSDGTGSKEVGYLVKTAGFESPSGKRGAV